MGSKFSPHKFAKVRIGRGRFRLIEVHTDTAERISGFRVDSNGSRWCESKEVDGVLHIREEFVIAEPAQVVQRLRLNLHFGQLEEGSPDTP